MNLSLFLSFDWLFICKIKCSHYNNLEGKELSRGSNDLALATSLEHSLAKFPSKFFKPLDELGVEFI